VKLIIEFSEEEFKRNYFNSPVTNNEIIAEIKQNLIDDYEMEFKVSLA